MLISPPNLEFLNANEKLSSSFNQKIRQAHTTPKSVCFIDSLKVATPLTTTDRYCMSLSVPY